MIVNLRLQQEDEEDALISFDMPDPAPYAAIIAEHGLTEASIEVPAYTIRPLFPLGTEHVEGWVSDEAREWVGFWLADNDEPEPEPVDPVAARLAATLASMPAHEVAALRAALAAMREVAA